MESTVTTTKPGQSLWVDSRVAIAALGISLDQLYRAIKLNRLSVRWMRVGGLLRFNAKDLGLFEYGIEVLPMRKAESPETSAKVSSGNSAFDHNQVSSSLTDGADLSNKKER